jgi:hypothetical protein
MRRNSKSSRAPLTPWDTFCKQKLEAFDRVHRKIVTLEPGVNFFVAVLNYLGAETAFSCEGHPAGFYITFKAPYKTAQSVNSFGFFTVEIEGANYWSMRLSQIKTQKKCRQILRWASEAWTTKLAHLAKSKTTKHI